MTRVIIRLSVLVLLLATMFSQAAVAAPDDGLVPIPLLKSLVTDLTGTLSPHEISSLEYKLRSFEDASGSQIAVLIIPTTKPEAIEQYSIRVVDQWKLGRKKIDDGILLLIAKDDHALRIEVGYGLEGAIPDAIAKRIIAEIIAPHFKNGDFYGGINAGVDSMINIISGEHLPPQKKTKHVDNTDSWVGLFFVAIFVVLFMQKIFGKLLGSGIVGGIVGILAWAALGSVIIAGIAAFIVFIIALFIGSGGGGHGSGGWGGGGWSGGGGGGWSGGGGGGFGGGGASGSW